MRPGSEPAGLSAIPVRNALSERSRAGTAPRRVWEDGTSEMSDDLLRFEFDRAGGQDTLWVTGELDVSTAAGLEHAAARSLDGRGGDFHLDVRAMTFMDSTGAQALLRLHRRLTGLGRRLVIVSPTRQVRLVLEILGLDRVLDVRQDRVVAPSHAKDPVEECS